jgi:urate oxidase/2-oxo-4-hydroxy-4-carboxy-5-ureidoimidazoline decarboxylase
VRITYGKLRVPLQRVTRGQDLLAAEVSVEVLGENFVAAYTEGDNRQVVATDTMKNFILRESLTAPEDTLEALVEHLADGFLRTYPVMEAVRVSAREHPFERLSGKLFAAHPGADHGVASVERHGAEVTDRRSGRHGLWLLKVTGSAFTRFARDEYTTLPERVDRPLYIRLDADWRTDEPIASAELRDHLAHTFDDFVSESIQHLVHEMATRALARWPQLREIELRAENHTRDPAHEEGERIVYTDPFPAQGLITLTMEREESVDV